MTAADDSVVSHSSPVAEPPPDPGPSSFIRTIIMIAMRAAPIIVIYIVLRVYLFLNFCDQFVIYDRVFFCPPIIR